MAVSWNPTPVKSQIVISMSRVRPGFLPATTSPSVPRTSASRMSPAAIACDSAFIGGGTLLSVGPEPTSAPPVPLPPAIWLLGSALVGVLGLGRRRAA